MPNVEQAALFRRVGFPKEMTDSFPSGLRRPAIPRLYIINPG